MGQPPSQQTRGQFWEKKPKRQTTIFDAAKAKATLWLNEWVALVLVVVWKDDIICHWALRLKVKLVREQGRVFRWAWVD